MREAKDGQIQGRPWETRHSMGCQISGSNGEPATNWRPQRVATGFLESPFCYSITPDGRIRRDQTLNTRWWVPEPSDPTSATTLLRRTIPLAIPFQ
jgi:hypothetical protein